MESGGPKSAAVAVGAMAKSRPKRNAAGESVGFTEAVPKTAAAKAAAPGAPPDPAETAERFEALLRSEVNNLKNSE